MEGQHGSFSTKPQPSEPITLDIDGEQFVANPWITGLTYLRLMKMMSSPLTRERATGYEQLFQYAFDREPSNGDVEHASEHARFLAFTEDPKRQVDTETIDSIVDFLLKCYGSRPTTPPSVSGSGRNKKEAGSKADSGSTDEAK